MALDYGAFRSVYPLPIKEPQLDATPIVRWVTHKLDTTGSVQVNVTANNQYTRTDAGSFLSGNWAVGDRVWTSGFANGANNDGDGVQRIEAIADKVLTVNHTNLVTETGSGDELVQNYPLNYPDVPQQDATYNGVDDATREIGRWVSLRESYSGVVIEEGVGMHLQVWDATPGSGIRYILANVGDYPLGAVLAIEHTWDGVDGSLYGFLGTAANSTEFGAGPSDEIFLPTSGNRPLVQIGFTTDCDAIVTRTVLYPRVLQIQVALDLTDPITDLRVVDDGLEENTVYNHELEVIDDSGNRSFQHIQTTTLDNPETMVPVLSPAGGDVAGNSVVVSLDSQGETKSAYTIDGTDPAFDGSGNVTNGTELTDNDFTLTFDGTNISVEVRFASWTSGTGTSAIGSVTFDFSTRVPIIADPSPTQITEGAELEFTVQTTWFSDEVPVLTITGTVAGDSANQYFTDNGDGTGTFTWTPSAGERGTYPVVIIATDGADPTKVSSKTVNIVVANNAPVIGSIGTVVAASGENINFTITATDADGDIPDISGSNLPTGATVIDHLDGTATFDWTPGDDDVAGSPYTPQINAADGIDASLITTASFVIKIQTPLEWPADLPQEPLKAGFSQTILDSTLRSQMGYGPDKVRRRSTVTIIQENIGLILTDDERSTLIDFYKNTVKGSQAFTWKDHATGDSATCRFLSPPQINGKLGANQWSVSFIMEIVP